MSRKEGFTIFILASLIAVASAWGVVQLGAWMGTQAAIREAENAQK
jgi:hypothetical protein